MAAVAAFGMLGLVIGTAGFVAHKSTSSKLTAVSGQVRALEGQQRQASDQLTAVRATMDSLNADPERAVTTEASAGPPPALPQQAVAPEPPAMAARGTETPVYSTPWPDSRPYTHRAVVVQRRRAVVAPNFLVAINRDLRALFH